MPISKTDLLFALVRSMTRGEKRHFRSFAQRESDGVSLLYLQLFDLLDKQAELDESALKKQFAKAQLPNLKRHLYRQIMVSLRLQQEKENSLIQLREYLDFANILYGKGLYLQSLKILDKAKKLAAKVNDELIMLQLLEFEKIIESRHITRTGASRVPYLTSQTEGLLSRINNRLRNSNLRLQLHGYYIQHGHVQSARQAAMVQDQYKNQLDEVQEEQLGLIEQAYYYQSRVWYHFILLDFDQCLKYAVLWLELFESEGRYMHRDSNLMMRAYHYILTALYHLGEEATYVKYLNEFEHFRDSNYRFFNKNSQVISFIYVHNGRLNKYILTKNYLGGLAAIPRTLARLRRYADLLDTHRVLVLQYKISLLYIMAGMPGKAIRHLFDIMNTSMDNLRQDVQAYARIAFLMAHFDLENYDTVEQYVKPIRRFCDGSQLDSDVSIVILDFFKQVVRVPRADRRTLLAQLDVQLATMEGSKYHQRGLLYLNAREWVKGHQ